MRVILPRQIVTHPSFHIIVFFSASIAEKEARNLIKFLLLSENRVDQFITACSQLPFSLLFEENSISSVSIIVVNTFSPLAALHLCFLVSHKEKPKVLFYVA
jgi:hypothetical protein